MWIRSQCLAILVKAKEICINDGTDIWANGYLIGEYSTEEKAFDVLDMIESWITHTTDGKWSIEKKTTLSKFKVVAWMELLKPYEGETKWDF